MRRFFATFAFARRQISRPSLQDFCGHLDSDCIWFVARSVGHVGHPSLIPHNTRKAKIKNAIILGVLPSDSS